jgi:hypothetical protein
MKTYTIKFNGHEVLKTKSYSKVYNFFTKALNGGLSFGIDTRTLIALGYSWEVK